MVRRGVVDGIPIYWAEQPGITHAELIFRVGWADETLPTLGISHLVEHLALHGLLYGTSVNGRVEADITAFTASGSPAEVSEALGRVARALTALPMERLEAERQVLLTEEQRQGWSLPALLLNKRYGARGLGLCNYKQFGLLHLDAPTVQAWAADRFNRSNAILVLVGPEPGLWSLPLGDGSRQPLVPSATIDHPLPARLEVSDCLGLSFEAERSAAGSLAIAATEKRLFERLRGKEGIAYSIGTEVTSPGLNTMHATLVTNLLSENAQPATEYMRQALADLTQEGISRQELDFLVSRMHPVDQPEEFGGYWAQRMAVRELLGMSTYGPDEARHEYAAVTPEAVLAQLRGALDRALFAFPSGAAIEDESIVEYQQGRGTPFSGPQLKPSPFVRSNGERLVVASGGVSLVEPAHHPITVSYEDCAALVTFVEGVRVLIGSDGQALTIDPRYWEDAQPALAAIDASVPVERRVAMRSLGEEPAPARRMPGRIVFWAGAVAGAAALLAIGVQVVRALHLPFSALSGLLAGYLVAIWVAHSRLRGLWRQRVGASSPKAVGSPAAQPARGWPSEPIGTTDIEASTLAAAARIRTSWVARWTGGIHIGVAALAGLLSLASLALSMGARSGVLVVPSAAGMAALLLSLFVVHIGLVIWVRDAFNTLHALGVHDLTQAPRSATKALTMGPDLRAPEAVFHELITASDPAVGSNTAWARMHHPMPPIWRAWTASGVVNQIVTFFAGIGIWLLPAGGLLRAMAVIPVVALNVVWAVGLLALVRLVDRNLPLRFGGTAGPAPGSAPGPAPAAAAPAWTAQPPA